MTRTALIALVGLSSAFLQTEALCQNEGTRTPSTRGERVQPVDAEALAEDIRSLARDIDTTLENRPVLSKNQGASKEARRLDYHRSKIAKWQEEVERLSNALEKAQADLRRAEAELQGLQEAELPQAREEDEEALKRRLEALKEELEESAIKVQKESPLLGKPSSGDEE